MFPYAGFMGSGLAGVPAPRNDLVSIFFTPAQAGPGQEPEEIVGVAISQPRLPRSAVRYEASKGRSK
jgi:hypothetical protein